MTLTELAGEPELVIDIGAIEYSFSELEMEPTAKLQAYVQKKAPHPLEDVKKHLAGLDIEDRHYLLDQARQASLEWPPDVRSQPGLKVLLATDEGKILTLYYGLQKHHPGSTMEGAALVLKMLEREAAKERFLARKQGRTTEGEDKIQRILACLFRLSLPSDEEGLPKGEGATSPNGASIGIFSTGDASKS